MAPDASAELAKCRRRLAEALGPDAMATYLRLMMSWFKARISREDFDHEARMLMSAEIVHLHNRFMLAVLAKATALGATSFAPADPGKSTLKALKRDPNERKRKTPGAVASLQARFTPAEVNLPAVTVPPANSDDRPLTYASTSGCLPDIGQVHGRMVVTAWEVGLDNVSDDAVRLLMQAIENAIKDVISAMLRRRNTYTLREGSFRHGPLSTYTQAVAGDAGLSWAEDDASEDILDAIDLANCASTDEPERLPASMDAYPQPTKGPLSLWDMLEALQTQKSCLPSHQVYAVIMERLICKLHHPTNEELSANITFSRQSAVS